MGALDQLTPGQKKLLGYGAAGVVGAVAIGKLTSRSEPAPATVTPIQPMPSTDAIGVGELGDYFSAFTDTLGQVTERISALEDAADADPTPDPDPSDSGPVQPPSWYTNPPPWWNTAPPGAPAGAGTANPPRIDDDGLLARARRNLKPGYTLVNRLDPAAGGNQAVQVGAGVVHYRNVRPATRAPRKISAQTAQQRATGTQRGQATSGLPAATYGGYIPVTGPNASAIAQANYVPGSIQGDFLGAVARYGGVYYGGGDDGTAEMVARKIAEGLNA